MSQVLIGGERTEIATDKAPTGPATFWGMDRSSLWVGKIAAVEFIAVATSAYLTSAFYHGLTSTDWQISRYLVASAVIATLFSCVSLGFGDSRKLLEQRQQQFMWSGVKSVALAFAFFLSIMFLLKIAEDYSRVTFVFQITGICATVIAVRGWLYARRQAAVASGRIQGRRAIIVGAPINQPHFVRQLRQFGIRTVENLEFSAFFDGPSGDIRRATVDALRTCHPDDVLLLATPDELNLVPRLVEALSQLPVAVHLVPVGIGSLLNSPRIAELGDVTTVQVLRKPLSTVDTLVKRLFDIMASLVGLALFSPLFLAVGLAIKLDTPGPVFFRQKRHGYNNQTISVIKFRSMSVSNANSRFTPTTRNDSRVTRVGRVIRKTSIDELPQLLNVLRGEMSIVGPRPHATAHNQMFEEQIAPFYRRHIVKPGITGWAQVNRCRGEASTLERMQKRVDHDLFYIDNWSFFLDLKILVMTFFLYFSKDDFYDVY